MSDADRAVNAALAKHLFETVMHGQPGPTLDIGAKLPMLASSLGALGCEPWVIEHEPIAHNLPHIKETLPWDVEDSGGKEPWIRYKLITLIHTFEHLYEPLRMLRKFRRWVSEDGAVFIRMPDHSVPGFERDLTEGHYEIHPFYHSSASLLALLCQTQDTFALESVEHMPGYGQTDFVLRPIARAPIIALCGIVKNEMRDLPKMLKSAIGAHDRLILIDTGSTDGTEKMCREVFTEANDEEGRLNDFSKARNHYLDIADKEADWVFVLDADDELKTPEAIRRASYRQDFDAYALWIEDSGARWTTHRMWRTNMGIRYEGRCHEYPIKSDNVRDVVISDSLIVHHGEPSGNQEDSNARNQRILQLEWQEKPTPRCAFYLANTYRDASQWKDAAYWYGQRIAMGQHFRDEWLFAHLYCGRALRAASQIDLAMQCLQAARLEQPDWCEFTLELASIAYDQKRYVDAINIAMQCVNQPIPTTNLWRERNAYTDQPARLISWCHEHNGDYINALAWSDLVVGMLTRPDDQWADRHQRLRSVVLQYHTVSRPTALAQPAY